MTHCQEYLGQNKDQVLQQKLVINNFDPLNDLTIAKSYQLESTNIDGKDKWFCMSEGETLR